MGGLRTLERLVKKVRGKDVPELELPKRLESLLLSLNDYLEEEAIEIVKDASEKAWDFLKGFRVNGEPIQREMYDAFVKALVDNILK